jgi:hypothetical protein
MALHQQPLALFQQFLASLVNPDSNVLEAPKHPQQSNQTQRSKPIRLIVSGRNAEVEERTVLIPYPIAVAGGDKEAVIARRQIRVLHAALIANLSPVFVLPLQLEPEMHSLWRHQTQRSVIDRQIVEQRRQAQSLHSIVCLVVRNDLWNEDRRQLIERATSSTTSSEASNRPSGIVVDMQPAESVRT